MVAGFLCGGRLGFVLFYEPSYYLENPLDIFAVWKGGMAFHGGLFGSGVAIWIFSRRNGINPWSTSDLCTATVPIGIFFGRIANFINGELFGRPTAAPWGMVFPEARLNYPEVEPTARHPSQLYEAALEGVVLFIVLRIATHRFLSFHRPGLTIGLFATGYGVARILVEFFRQPDAHIGDLTGGVGTTGTVLSFPMVLVGVVLLWWVSGQAAEWRYRAASRLRADG